MLERLRPGVTAHNARVCLFDFDGTISLIRSGWMDVMVPMMVEILLDLHTGESESSLRAIVEDFIWRLTGKQTMYQMIAFADQISQRGGAPLPPLAYKNLYLDRLHARIHHRLDGLRRHQITPDRYLVPGARPFLEALRDRGLRLYLASGTDQPYMREEADLLDVARYFGIDLHGEHVLVSIHADRDHAAAGGGLHADLSDLFLHALLHLLRLLHHVLHVAG